MAPGRLLNPQSRVNPETHDAACSRRHFFVAGAQRSGTTYLYRLLDEHPEIEMAKPLRPEPKVFLSDDLFARGRGHYETAYFGKKRDATVRGEKSTSYMESSRVAERIAAWFPAARIVFVLRDPIERAISHYRFSVRNGFETLSLAEAFLREDERRDDYDRARVSVSPYAYLSRGCYINSLLLYERCFPGENISVLLYEELVSSAHVVRGLYAALGVDPDFAPPSRGKQFNVGGQEPVDLPRTLREYVTRYYREPTARLAEHLGLDLGRWWGSARAEVRARRRGAVDATTARQSRRRRRTSGHRPDTG